MNLKYIVYVTVNLCNGKLYFGVHKTNPNVFDGYIGCGIYRPQQATKQFAFHQAVRKYGYENFRRIIIETFPETEEGKQAAYDLEKQIVTSTLLKSKFVYNLTKGGQYNDNDHLKKRVYMFDLRGNFLRSYKGVHDAALDISSDNVFSAESSIKNCCYGVSMSALGYYWSYEKLFIAKEEPNYKIQRRRKPIAQYSLDGKFITYYDNIDAARKATGLTAIHFAIAHKSSNGNFQWRFYNGDDSDIEPYENGVTRFRTKPIILTTPEGLDIEYPSLKQCMKFYPHLKRKGLQSVLRGEHRSHFGYKCRYKDEDIV